jgi:uncharacterized Zn finger protein
MSATVTVTCPKCSNTFQMVAQDTKIIYSYALCSKCGNIWRVR